MVLIDFSFSKSFKSVVVLTSGTLAFNVERFLIRTGVELGGGIALGRQR